MDKGIENRAPGLLGRAVTDESKGVHMKKGEWKTCTNPNCGEKYHIDKNKIVDIPCKCLAKTRATMLAFNRELAQRS